jgi:hypothetical protein
MSFAGKWIELEDVMLSKISQVQKYKYCMLLLLCGIYTEKKVQHDMIVKWNHFGEWDQ